MAEEATKELESELKELTVEHQAWTDALKRYHVEDEQSQEVTDNEPDSETEQTLDLNGQQSVDGDPTAASTTTNAEKVVDTLYPENNETEEGAQASEEVQDADSDVPESEIPNADSEEQIPESENNQQAESETTEVNTEEFDFNDNNKSENDDANGDDENKEEDEWPEYPEEWK